MPKKIILILIIVSLFSSWSDLNDIRSPRKSIKKVAEFVLVEGRWKTISATTVVERISNINFTSITCDLKNKTCNENLSLLQNPKENELYKKPMLYSLKFTYQITDWTNDIIKAKWDAPVADVEIIISLKDNIAEKSYRETKARGSETSNPNIYGKWVLE